MAGEIRHKKGLTLVELMVALAIGAMLMTMIIMLYTMAVKTYTLQTMNVEQMQNLRATLQHITREVSMAGSGFQILKAKPVKFLIFDRMSQKWLLDEEGDCIVPLSGTDGGTSGSDSLTLCRFEAEFAAPVGYLRSPLRPGDSSLQIHGGLMNDAALPVDEVLSPQDMLLVITPQGIVVAVQALSVIRQGLYSEIAIDQLPSAFLNGVDGFPAGSTVYNVKKIILTTYYIENNNLMVKRYDPALGLVPTLVAPGIEDFQVAYYKNDEKSGDLSSGHHEIDFPGSISSVRIALMSVSANPMQNNPPKPPPALFNRTESRVNDSLVRQILSETVRLRNNQ